MANDVKWIKITTDIFDNWKIKTIKAMPEGHKMICIWVQLLCIAGARNEHGMIIFPTQMCTTDDVLATVIGEDKLVVSMALEVFSKLGMIMVDDDNSMIQISNWEEYQSVDGLEKIRKDHAARQAKYREKQKLKLEKKSDVTVTSRVTYLSYSYSISNNNYINTNNILNIYIDKYNYINTNDKLKESLLEWMEYKDSSKPKSKHFYSSEKTLCKMITQVQNKAKEYGIDYVVDCIDNSIAHQWQGINWKSEVVKKDLNNNNLTENQLEMFNYTFKQYPKNANYESSKIEWLRKTNGEKEKAKDLYNALKMYLSQVADKQYIPNFDKWLREDSEYWIMNYKRGDIDD